MKKYLAEGKSLSVPQIKFIIQMKESAYGKPCPVCDRYHKEVETFAKIFCDDIINRDNAVLAFRYPKSIDNLKRYGVKRIFSEENCVVVNSFECERIVQKGWIGRPPPWEGK